MTPMVTPHLVRLGPAMKVGRSAVLPPYDTRAVPQATRPFALSNAA